MNEQVNIVPSEDSLVTLAKELNLGALQEPPAVPFTFEAIGWPMLAGLILIIVILIAFWQIRKYGRNKYRREALTELKEIVEGKRALEHSFVVLKRTAILAYSREKVGYLSGKLWLQFLEKSGKKVEMLVFEKDIKNLIYKGVMPEKNIEQKLLLNTERWIRTHAAR